MKHKEQPVYMQIYGELDTQIRYICIYIWYTFYTNTFPYTQHFWNMPKVQRYHNIIKM